MEHPERTPPIQELAVSMENPVPILLYHSVNPDPPSWIAPFSVSPATFAAHLDEIVASGRQPLTVSQYVDGLAGRDVLPPRPVLITVDDGFADFADHALAALVERNLPSTLYVTTGALSDRKQEAVLPWARMLASTDLAGLEAAGVEIGAHTHTHRQLDLLQRGAVVDEVLRSGSILAAILGHRIRSFAYPHGYWSMSVRRLIGQAGFDSSCAVGGTFSSDRDHQLALSRFMVRSDTDVATVRAWMTASTWHVRSCCRRALALSWRQYRRVRYGAAASWPDWGTLPLATSSGRPMELADRASRIMKMTSEQPGSKN
jgi:peptidoglycan/xylan/chitin deacetylase (PgdA/CDA1 family)